MTFKTVSAMATACLLVARVAAAQALPTPEFINKAAHAGTLEIELAQMAITTSKTPEIVAAANKIKTDHETASKELLAIATQKHHTPPGLTEADRATAHGKLAKLTGADFDKAWVEQMVRDHTNAIGLFSRAASSSDADIAAFATKTLPVLRAHLKTLESIGPPAR